MASIKLETVLIRLEVIQKMDYFQSISPMTHHLDVKKVRKTLPALILALLILNLECVNAQTSPVTQIDFPVNGGNYNSIASINGLVSGTGIVNVTISIQRGADGKYWDGVLWRTDPFRLLTTVALPNWAYTSSVSWIDGSYTVNSRAGNSSGYIESPGATITFTYDTTDPTSTITVPADVSLELLQMQIQVSIQST
jgi:hypothetical protein